MELIEMTDKELAQRMVNYINRLESLIIAVSKILDENKIPSQHTIDIVNNEYKNLKENIKEDAHYVGVARNKKPGNNLYNNNYTTAIINANAQGFKSPINSRIDDKLFSSLRIAHVDLLGYFSLNQWNEIANNEI